MSEGRQGLYAIPALIACLLAGSSPDGNCQTNKLAFWCFSELLSDEGIRALHRTLLESLSIVYFSSFIS